MKKAFNYLYIIIFVLMLLVPLIFTNTQANYVSEIENRTLVDLPEFGSAGFTSEFEAYMQDRIGFRNKMVNWYAVINDVLFNELTHPMYTYGTENYVFFNMHKNIDYSNYHKSFAKMVASMQEYCESRGSRFYFMFEPEKISVLREHLPIGVNYNDDWVEEMLSYMDSLGINCINNKSILIEKSKTENVFNVQYDAGHWNDLGCFYSTNNLLQKIHIDFPQVTELQMGDFTISTKTEKYLPVSEFIVNEQVPSFSLNSGWNDFTTDYAAEIEINNNYSHFHYYENTMENAAILPKTMIFQGSYYNSRPQFLVSRTHEDIGIHNYQNVFNLDYYFNIFEPDIVIFEVTEYTFSDVYFDSLKMNQSKRKVTGWIVSPEC